MTTVSPPQGTDRPVQGSRGPRDSGRFRTTPGRLRLLSIVSVGAILVLLVVSAGALSSRRSAARSVGEESGSLLVDVQALYHALADADATASRSLLAAGGDSSEIREQREQYVDDLAEAGNRISAIAQHSQSSREARDAIAVIAQELPRYTEKVEAARVQNRLGYPVGAQHMRDASQLMRERILPSTLVLYTVATDKLHGDYDRGTSATQMVWIVVIGVVTLAVLVVAQVYTARHTNRTLNVGLLAATTLVAVLLVWSLARFDNEQDALVTAQRQGSDSMQLLSTARILALQTQANANIALAERGTGSSYRDEFARLMRELCGTDECSGGVLADVQEVAGRTGRGARIVAIRADAARLRSAANEVMRLDDDGDYVGAVDLALGDQAIAADALDGSIVRESRNARAHFDEAADDARGGFAVLAVALVVGLLLAGALVLAGMHPRITEYR